MKINAYQAEVEALFRADKDGCWQAGAPEKRIELVQRYAWAIPNEEALSLIAQYGPIVEGGAGTGYWAHLLRERGVDVAAYDSEPYNNEYACARWTEVEVGGAEAMKAHQKRALLLCWPPYDTPMAYQHVLAHGGDTLIYIGESADGCTGDAPFHDLLDREFEEVDRVEIPNFHFVRDRLVVYRRK